MLVLNGGVGFPLAALKWLEALCRELKLPAHFATVDMSDAKSLEASLLHVSNLNGDGSRKRLIIAGSNLEDAVTFQCLEALAFGFDVFLPSDLIRVSKPMFASLHWDRLKQAGAVPTTMIQMLNEWSLCARDISMGESIARCANEFGQLEL